MPGLVSLDRTKSRHDRAGFFILLTFIAVTAGAGILQELGKNSHCESYDFWVLVKGAVKKVPQKAGCAERCSLQNYYRETADSSRRISRLVV